MILEIASIVYGIIGLMVSGFYIGYSNKSKGLVLVLLFGILAGATWPFSMAFSWGISELAKEKRFRELQDRQKNAKT